MSWYHLSSGCERCRAICLFDVNRVTLFGEVVARCKLCGTEKLISTTGEGTTLATSSTRRNP